MYNLSSCINASAQVQSLSNTWGSILAGFRSASDWMGIR